MLKIRSNLIFILEKNLKEELLLLQGCVQEKRPFFFLDLSLFERTFLLQFSTVKSEKKPLFDTQKLAIKYFKNLLKKREEEERWDAWDMGHPTLGCPLLFSFLLGDKQHGNLTWCICNCRNGWQGLSVCLYSYFAIRFLVWLVWFSILSRLFFV